MGFYRKVILPQLVNLAMKNENCSRCRSQVIPAAHGRVLEIGIGSGLNLPFYSRNVEKVYGVDPSTALLEMARKRVVSARLETIMGAAQDLPIDNEAIDTVVTTWTLCSIPDASRALAEMRRVLKSDGDLLFVEHGLAPEPRVRAWQNRLNSAWRAIAGGCNLNRQIDLLISSAGFSIIQLDTMYLSGPKMLNFTYRGRARKQ
jgi:ubiquinone/menaquinone biosynthesis C-methylase UbiE